MRALRKGLQGAGIPVENSKGEASPGQAEINVRYAEALTMADRHAIIKNATKEIAWSKGKAVTFLPSGTTTPLAVPRISTSRCGAWMASRLSSTRTANTACRM